MKGLRFALAAGLLAAGSAHAAILYQTDFETDQSSSFTVAASTGIGGTEANFAFDYSTFVPTTPTTPSNWAIGAAPSAAGTKGLKLRANFLQPDGSGVNEGVTAFVNAGTGLADWKLTFDAYQMWNGPEGSDPPGGTGTTTAMTMGNATTARPFHTLPTDFDGWFLMITAEGGSGTDLRYSSASNGTPVANNTLPNWVSGVNMGSASGYATAFPLGTFTTSPIPGTTGRQWITWVLQSQSGTVTLSATPVGGPTTQMASWTQTADKTPGVGFFDLFTGSVSDPPSDNFLVIDNLKLEDFNVSDVEGWSLYQ